MLEAGDISLYYEDVDVSVKVRRLVYYLLHYSMKASEENIPLKRYSEIRKIVDYNKVDCQVVYEIVDFLKL